MESINDLLIKEGHPLADILASQRDKGIVKYGEPLNPENLSYSSAFRHALEDAVDTHVYVRNLVEKVESDGMADAHAVLYSALILAEDLASQICQHLDEIRREYQSAFDECNR